MSIKYKKATYDEAIVAVDFAFNEMVSNNQIEDTSRKRLMFTKLNLAKVNENLLDVYIASDSSNIIGVIGFEKDFIDFLFVNKKYQKKGIATKLVNYLLKDALKNGVKTIRLDATKEGYEFYKKLLFVDDLNKGDNKYIPMKLDTEIYKNK